MISTTDFSSSHATDHPSLGPGEVHVWRARLSDAHRTAPEEILTPEEWIRAGRLPLESDRENFVAERSLLRTILGRYLGLSPRNLRFSPGPHGKPELAGVCSSL